MNTRRNWLSLAAIVVALTTVVSAAQAAEFYSQAQQDFRARRYADAETKLRSLIQSAPDDYQARYLLVRSLIRDKGSDEALQAAEEAVRLAPNEAYARLALGDACYRAGLFGRAKSAYFAATELDPKLARAHLGYGLVLAADRRGKSAKESFKMAFELDPGEIGFRID